MGKVYLEKYKREQFKNVFFITGTATGGKTTISKALAEKYGWLRYDVDERFDEHKKLSNPINQPNMNKTFKNSNCIMGELYSYINMKDFFKNGAGVALVVNDEVVGFCLSEYSVKNSLGANILDR